MSLQKTIISIHSTKFNMSLNEIHNNSTVSIIIPTYNESKNILSLLDRINDTLSKSLRTQIIIVDDNSPDGTGIIVENHIKNLKQLTNNTINILHRKTKNGLGSAIMHGIKNAVGDLIVVMDSDLSHPPTVIPKLINTLKKSQCDIVIASRYVSGGSILNWNFKRKLMSKVATFIAKRGLGLDTKDPMSGFFAFKKNILDGINLDALGYKILLEMLVKTRNTKIKEIPYTFQNRKAGSSKLDASTISDYCKSVWKLYLYGKNHKPENYSSSTKFFSKLGRFFTIGASGFAINYITSIFFTLYFASLWYIHANIIGIILSMTSNFVLNKIWTFEDRDFGFKKTLTQYTKFIGLSSIGALIQIGFVYYLTEFQAMDYPVSLLVAVISAAFGNFILNKKLTFKEKLWS